MNYYVYELYKSNKQLIHDFESCVDNASSLENHFISGIKIFTEIFELSNSDYKKRYDAEEIL